MPHLGNRRRRRLSAQPDGQTADGNAHPDERWNERGQGQIHVVLLRVFAVRRTYRFSPLEPVPPGKNGRNRHENPPWSSELLGYAHRYRRNSSSPRKDSRWWRLATRGRES